MIIDYNCQSIDDKYVDMLKEKMYRADVQGINRQFATYLDTPYFKMLNSGTSALMLSLRSLDIPKHKEILGPSYAHPAWLNASRFLGHENIGFIDVRKETLSMRPDSLRKRITRDTGAVFFVNMNGYVGEDLFEIRETCNHFGVKLIEDACNAFGQSYNGVLAGTVGDIGCYSFGTPKILTSGEGGAIVTKDRTLYDRIDDLSYQGGWYKYGRSEINYGGNFAVPATTRILLSEQLKDIDILFKKRHDLFMTYKNNINSGYMHEYPIDDERGYSMNVLLDGDIEKIGNLKERLGINVSFGIYKSLGQFFDARCEVSEYIEKHSTFLPVYITEAQAKIVCGIT